MKLTVGALALALLVAGCARIAIPPEKAAWAQSVREKIARANETNFVYLAVADEQEAKMVERLAVQGGKESQRIVGTNGLSMCIFLFHREYYLR